LQKEPSTFIILLRGPGRSRYKYPKSGGNPNLHLKIPSSRRGGLRLVAVPRTCSGATSMTTLIRDLRRGRRHLDALWPPLRLSRGGLPGARPRRPAPTREPCLCRRPSCGSSDEGAAPSSPSLVVPWPSSTTASSRGSFGHVVDTSSKSPVVSWPEPTASVAILKLRRSAGTLY
jgi:hypothetical protein